MLAMVGCDKQRDYARHVKRFESPLHDNRTYGTGFNMKIGDKVYTVTNRHVCEVSDELGYSGVAQVNGEAQVILKMSDKYDLCVLTSNADDGFELAENDVEPLDKITLIGHPRGLDLVH